jgi:hypothetical protein
MCLLESLSILDLHAGSVSMLGLTGVMQSVAGNKLRWSRFFWQALGIVQKRNITNVRWSRRLVTGEFRVCVGACRELGRGKGELMSFSRGKGLLTLGKGGSAGLSAHSRRRITTRVGMPIDARPEPASAPRAKAASERRRPTSDYRGRREASASARERRQSRAAKHRGKHQGSHSTSIVGINVRAGFQEQ